MILSIKSVTLYKNNNDLLLIDEKLNLDELALFCSILRARKGIVGKGFYAVLYGLHEISFKIERKHTKSKNV